MILNFYYRGLFNNSKIFLTDLIYDRKLGYLKESPSNISIFNRSPVYPFRIICLHNITLLMMHWCLLKSCRSSNILLLIMHLTLLLVPKPWYSRSQCTDLMCLSTKDGVVRVLTSFTRFNILFNHETVSRIFLLFLFTK